MKLKSKILSCATLIGLATAVAPISLSSCSTQKQEKEVTIPTVKLKTSVAPNEIDMNDLYIPFTCENASTDVPAAISVELPSTLGISMYYRTPVQSQTGWGAWTALTPDETNYIEFEAGYKVQLVAYCSANPGKAFSSYGNQIKIDLGNAKLREQDVPNIKVGGNACSFLATQNPAEAGIETTIECANQLYSEYEFKNLFNGSEMMTEVGHNFLPFKQVTKGCYEGMFSGCQRLITAPILPATTHNIVSEYSITKTEEGLAEECYKDMFKDCTWLTVAPDLPAVKLAKNCYTNIYYNCSQLVNISLAYVGNFNETFFQNWVYGVARTGSIYYNGLDESKTYKYQIPTNFSIVQNQDLITNYCQTLKVVADETSVVPEEGVEVRAYKDQTFGDIEDTLYKGTSASGDDFDHFEYNSTSTEIESTTKVEDFTDKTLKPVYLFDAPIIDGAVNCFVSQQTKLSLSKTQYNGLTTGWKLNYSIDKGENWSELTTSSGSITIPAKTQLLLASSNTWSGSTYGSGHITHGSSSRDKAYIRNNIKFTGGSVRLAGNCMNLAKGTRDGTAPTAIPNEHCFAGLFAGSTGITKIEKGFLPATELKSTCYCNMFDGCTNLKSVPTDLLPATEFQTSSSYARGAYAYMFQGCTSLKNAPNLPATTLYGNIQCKYYQSNGGGGSTGSTYVGAYYAMFNNCTSLETAPTISANTISDSSSNYGDVEFGPMFQNCTSLVEGPKINISSFKNVKHYDSYSGGYLGTCQSMFKGCTKLVKIDLTSITELGTDDLRKMFQGCSSLNVTTSDTGTLFFTCPTYTSGDRSPVEDMFNSTKGITSDPTAREKYYLVTE